MYLFFYDLTLYNVFWPLGHDFVAMKIKEYRNCIISILSLILIHTLNIHYAHAAANLYSGYPKYVKVTRMHYFCTIALWTSRAVLMRARALRRVDLFSKRGRPNYILLVIFKRLLNLLKCLIYHMKKYKKVCLRCVWIRLTTAYLLCSREFRQNNALALQFWCLSNALTLRVHALDASKSQRMCIILLKFTCKSK